MFHAIRPVSASLALFAALGFAASQPALAAPKGKADLCHRNGSGGFNAISVSENAVPSHLAHGDVLQPNGAVPGSPGYVFNSQCAPVTWDYFVNAPLDVSAQTPAGNMLVGSGIPASGFGIARNQASGIELGLGIIYRQGPTVLSTDNYNDGVLNFSVASGPQSTTNGSFANNANRAAWSFQYSIATGLNGAPSTLTNHTYQILVDVDPGPGTSYRTWTYTGGVWKDSGFTIIADDGTNGTVTQNSQNYGFGYFQMLLTSPYGLGSGFAGPGQFDIVMQALDGAQIVASNHIVVNVAAP